MRAVWIGVAAMLVGSGCQSDDSREVHDAATAVASCLDGGPLPVLPEGVTFVDPAAPDDGTEPVTTRCTRIVRVASLAATPPIVAAHPGQFAPTFTYFFRADDGAIVMIDAGFTLWVTGMKDGAPVVEPNLALRTSLGAAVAALAPGKTLADVKTVYLDHGHPDHTMQVQWVHEATGAPVDLWMGAGDVPLVQSRTAAASCTGQLPSAAAMYLPVYLAPDYVIHPVPTDRVATEPSQWVDGGHGIQLISAPSHTQGTILVYLPSVHAVIASNHLRRGETASTNDCSSDSSTCHVDCASYFHAVEAFPAGARILHVHLESITGGG